MPEDCITENDLERVLDDLEDYSLNARNYQTLLDTLDSLDYITAPTAEKLLSLCINDSIEDLKYTTHLLNIISTLLKKIKKGRCTPLPNLVPSALTVLNVLYTTAEYDKLEALKLLCFEIINSYPDETLNSLGINYSEEIFKIIDLYCHQSSMISTDFRLQTINIVGKVLPVLPPDKRGIFVKDGMRLWFSPVIPLLVGETVNATNNTVLNLLEQLELLTDELVQFDYANDPDWGKVLENIHTPEKYPTVIITLLEKGSAYWHRLWIVFIKLLKNQITKCTSRSASPINALLPCVEMAFKMGVSNRCRAFLCWDVLIDNFSNETSETLICKRLKLLMVPLTSNNAKVEETALAKFKTWWHLITRFQTKLDKFVVMVVIPFLSFCFGKKDVNLLVPGKISDKTKVHCVQAFINIVGHTQCEGCVRLPGLNTKLFNTQLLVYNWREWIYAIGNAIRICVEQHSEFNEKQINCVWKTFILTIGELAENNIRRDLYNEVLGLLEELTQDCDNRLMGIIVNVLIPTLFATDGKILPLLKPNEKNAPVDQIIAVLSKLPLDNLEDRTTALESIKVMTNWMVNEVFKTSSNKLELLVKMLSSNGVLLWTALADSIRCCGFSVYPRLLAQMFLWPFNYMNNFVNKEESTAAWINLYKTMGPYLKNMKSIHKDIIKALMTRGDNQSSCLFVLSATIAVLENKLQEEDTHFTTEIALLLQLTSKVNETQIKLILPSLAVVIVHALTALNKNINEAVVENIMFIINNILKMCKVIFEEQPDNGSDLINYIRNIFNSLESTFKLDSYSKLKSNLVDQLIVCAPYLKNDKLLQNHILAIYKTYVNQNLADNISEEVVKAFENVEVSNSVNLTPNQKENSKNFTTPSGKAAKRSKREATVTNTVIENGEEFVVVKSNWKFNPRKLTENQKEKLQRKREDIPAMYQDLSQSQDEFKLSTWKTDSQDTSTTSSKSTNLAANENVSVILKNLPNTEFFPKIIENVTTKPVTDLTQNTESSKEKLNINNVRSENDKVKNAQNLVKNVKSPRMLLKDRVSRNVRNLTERTNLGQECTDVSVNILKTPVIAKVKPSSNFTNSAPSQSNLERPSREKRKPKKFDDLEFAVIKRRRSLSRNSQDDVEITGKKIQIDTTDITKEDKHKENNADSLELINNPIDNSAGIKGDNTVEHHGNDKLENKISVSNSFDVTENLIRTNDAVKKFLDKEKEACLNSKNRALATRTLNETDEKTGQISGSQDFNNIDKTVHDEIKEKICTVTLDNTLLTPKSNKSKDSNNMNESVHDKIKEKVQENICTVTLENTLSTLKSNQSKDLNNINQSAQDKIKEKIQKNLMCTVTLENFLSTPKSNECEEQDERKAFTDSEKKVLLTPEVIRIDSDGKEKSDHDESNSNVVLTPIDIKKKITIQGKSCHDNTDNSKLCIISNVLYKMETVKEKVERNLSADDNTAAVPTTEVTDKVTDKQICSSKKSSTKKSRIERQLKIDMVEGHPFMNAQSEKRSTRKSYLKSPLKQKRLSLNPDNYKFQRKNTTKEENKTKDKEKSISIKGTPNSEDICASQDFIESSQDSAVTTISVKSSKPFENKKPVVLLEDVIHAIHSDTDTQNLIDAPINIDVTNMESNSDIELPCNKTDLTNLTEEMDTEPIYYNVVVVLSYDEDTQLPVISDKVSLGSDMKNTADADTEPVDPNMFIDTNCRDKPSNVDEKDEEENTQTTDNPESDKISDEIAEIIEDNETNASLMATDEDITKTLSESVLIEAEKDDSSTSCNNEQRKKDFLDNTLQISPIKSMSPVRDEKSPSPETSSDYVVIKLTSPVQSNGQPFEICESPEIFTEDKVSPDKRDQSPPREEVSVKSTSPSSSLSLKKNRPQMRPGGRAAQMLGLCVPDSLQTMTVPEKPTEPEEAKRSSCLNTSARRNLRILYNSSTGESNDTSDDTEDSESFLKFKRTVPASDCSPSGPILKRKFIDLTDDTTVSPASKRKRVSFHDPPVSTTICVKKYIEPITFRSPQNSGKKRLERQTVKSPRRLENAFKLDSVLNKAVESFSGAPETMNEDTEMSSLDETPVVEVIKTSDLNDTDPICKELVDCEDHIENIAAELSSPAMKALLVKKFEGMVESIGDLAKMTELEVNRLCIKAPKVQVAKKVLNEYLSKLKQANEEITPTVEAAMSESTVLEAKSNKESQTDTTSIDSIAAQTDCVAVSLATSQTDEVKVTHSFVQTNESGSKSTTDILTDCISQRPDFVESLCETLDEASKQKIVENLPYDSLIKVIVDKSNGDGKHVLPILEDRVVERFDSKDIILFCSHLLQKVYGLGPNF